MPTILELFKGSPQDLAVSATGNSSKSDFVKSVKTFVDQETSGIRIKSLVEANNPLIYGTGAIRIANRSIQTTEIQKDGTKVLSKDQAGQNAQSEQGVSGLGLGKKLSEARDAVTSKLGFPTNLIPTTVLDSKVNQKDVFRIKGGEQDTMTNLAQIRQDGAGTGLGQFLKSTGGGNPQTVGKHALGQGVGLVKDKLRQQTFGDPQSITQISGGKLDTNYNSETPYSDYLIKLRNKYTEGGEIVQNPPSVVGIPGVPAEVLQNAIPMGNQSVDKVDLKLVSPVYGIERADGRFGVSEYAYKTKSGTNKAPVKYDPTKGYQYALKTINGDSEPLKNKRGFSGLGDAINQLAPSDKYTREEAEGLGLIPFWVSGLDSTKPVFFRAILSSITETVSPTWNSDNFVGNPYSFYTYEGVERDLSFTLQLYCMNELELIKNWEKIEYLTSKTYPIINKESSFINAPFIKFRLGNMYVDKVAFIDQLSYTVDDNSTWETDADGMLLPKFIDVQATFKFVEWEGIERTLYNFRRNPEAIKQLKDEQSKFEERRESLGTVVEKKSIPSYNSVGSQAVEPPAIQKASTTGKGGSSSAPKDINTGKEISTPKEQNQESRQTVSSAAGGDRFLKLNDELKTKYNFGVGSLIAGQFMKFPKSKESDIRDGKYGLVYFKLIRNDGGVLWTAVNPSGGSVFSAGWSRIASDEQLITWLEEDIEDYFENKSVERGGF